MNNSNNVVLCNTNIYNERWELRDFGEIDRCGK